MTISADVTDIARQAIGSPTDESIQSKDVFDVLLHAMVGRPNGAHVQPATVQHIGEYRHVTCYIVQTVRTEAGMTVFVEQTGADGFKRYILPPKVLALIDRQREQATTQVRRRHGRRLAENRAAAGVLPVFTPEMRKKAAETRKRNAARRRAGRKA